MGLKKILISWFDPLESKDENQKKYRETFGIVDRYLLQYSMDDNNQTGFIVFIDREYDIDWIDNDYTNQWSQEEKKLFSDTIGRLDKEQTYPTDILRKSHRLNFKRILGVGYTNAFHKSFDDLDDIIAEARKYVEERSKEKARTIFLTVASLCILVCTSLFLLQKYQIFSLPWNLNYSAAIIFGMAGAYVSIWSRFKQLKMKGLSSKFALWVESLSRLLVGCVSSIVIIMFFNVDLILTLLKNKEPIYVYSIIAFVAGFSERWLTSIVERFIDQENKNHE